MNLKVSPIILINRVIGMKNVSPYIVFEKLFPPERFELVATETNRYAKTVIEKLGTLLLRSRYHNWNDVSAVDIKTFIAVEIGMVFVHKPTVDLF